MNLSYQTARSFLLGLLCLLWAVTALPAHDTESSTESSDADAPRDKDRDGDQDRDQDQKEDRDRHGKDKKHDRDDEDQPFGGVTADELSKKDIRRVLEVLDEANPPMAQRLRDLRQQSESEFREAIARAASSRRIRWLMVQKRFNPEGFRLRAAEYRLRHRMDRVTDRLAEADADSEEADELKQELRSLLGQAFEARQKVREQELARLERRIEHLRSELKEKEQRKEELIDRRYQELLRDPADFDYRRKDRKYKDDKHKDGEHKDRDDGETEGRTKEKGKDRDGG